MYIEPSIRGLLTVFYRRKAKFNAVFALVAVLGAVYLSGMQRVYEAHGSFLIKAGQNAMPAISGGSGAAGDDASPAAHAELVQSNIRILMSDDLLSAVIKKVGVDRLYSGISQAAEGNDSPEHAAIERLQKDLVVTNDTESSIVEVSFSNKDPQVAKDFTASLIETFIARQTEIFSAPHSDFLEKQIVAAQQKLVDAQKKFQDFQQQVGVSDLNQEVTSLLAEKTALSSVSLQAVTVDQQNLTKLESDRAAAMSTYKTDSPIIQRLNDSIAIAQAEVRKRQQDLNASGGDGSSLAPKIAKIDERMAYLEAHRGEYTQREEDVKMSEDDYKNYRQQGEEARGHELLNAQGITRISVVDRPVVPVKAEPLKRRMILIAILLTGFLLGLGAVILSEFLDESVSYPEQITSNTGLPVLASFGRVHAS